MIDKNMASVMALSMIMLSGVHRKRKQKRRPMTIQEKIEHCEYWAIRDNREYWRERNKDLYGSNRRNKQCSCGLGQKVKRCHG